MRQLTDVNGAVTYAAAYAPYGFTGMWTDPTGLVYLRTKRAENPQAARRHILHTRNLARFHPALKVITYNRALPKFAG